MIIVLVGPTSSGKSSFASQLRNAGVDVSTFDDATYKSLIESERQIINELAKGRVIVICLAAGLSDHIKIERASYKFTGDMKKILKLTSEWRKRGWSHVQMVYTINEADAQPQGF